MLAHAPLIKETVLEPLDFFKAAYIKTMTWDEMVSIECKINALRHHRGTRHMYVVCKDGDCGVQVECWTHQIKMMEGAHGMKVVQSGACKQHDMPVARTERDFDWL